MSERRILFLFTEVYANGGIQRFNQTLLAACGQLNAKCTVLSLQDSTTSIARHPLPPQVSVTAFGGNRWRFMIDALRVLWFERFDQVILGHVNLMKMAVVAIALRPFARPPMTLVAHGIEVWSGIGWSRRRALARLAGILCVSQYTRQRLLEQAPGLHPERLHVFPNALADTWTQCKPAAGIRALPQRFILSVTRLERGDRYKGIVTVIEALSMVVDTSLQYIVVGQGEDVPFLQQVARRCGVTERVHFCHGISDAELVKHYEQCLAFVLPSGNEGFGIVFLEAMYFGAPVLAAAEKGALDVVRDADTGLLVRFGDVSALRAAIERITADTALRERLRAHGRATVTGGGAFTFDSFRTRSAQALHLREAGAA